MLTQFPNCLSDLNNVCYKLLSPYSFKKLSENSQKLLSCSQFLISRFAPAANVAILRCVSTNLFGINAALANIHNRLAVLLLKNCALLAE